jgi:EAL domain-containing protein (putative c-di-GMP-specific phosphodiesterase class I)
LFQPVVDREKKCIGYEALARWEHPTLGLIMPDEFIQIAERDGLIIEIGDVIFRLILSQFHSQVIAKYGLKFKLMLNASVHQMMHARFSDVFASLCMEHDVPLDMVEIEITETAFLSHPEAAVRTMNALESQGVKFSLDDFGTGYSSLNFLQKVPVNTLKIDKEFISKIDPDGENIILDNIMSLARSLSVNVVAEGVENEDQFNVLYAKGCQYFQGWYFGRPSKTIE